MPAPWSVIHTRVRRFFRASRRPSASCIGPAFFVKNSAERAALLCDSHLAATTLVSTASKPGFNLSRTGYKVVYLPFKAGAPSGPQDVVTGFFTQDGKSKGQPVGVALVHNGALLIADDVGNAIWWVSAAASQPNVTGDRPDCCSRMRVRAHRFLRCATPRPSREQTVVFAGRWFKSRCDDHKSKRWIETREGTKTNARCG
jgi:hypothetical protein